MNVTKEMVDRFLCWKLPADFYPDAGISFAPGHTLANSPLWPAGTNLLTATQANEMLEHVLGSAQQPTETITSENNELLRTAANALLRQIEICDFTDSNGLEAKMLKARHDLMRILGKGECESVSDKSCKVADEVRAKVIGVGRDAENDRVMVVYFDKPPSNDRLRGLNEMMRTRDELDSGLRLIGYVPVYELSRLESGHTAMMRSAKFGPSELDGDVPVYVMTPNAGSNGPSA